MRFELTAEQRRVVECPEPKFSVSASAGSGKTRVLTERYLHFVLERDLSPQHILTITFTNKAAAEMKRRITTGLRNAGRIQEAQQAEVGPIQTLDSFCQQILKENALAAGVDPDFSVRSNHDQLLSHSVREALEDYVATTEGGLLVDPAIMPEDVERALIELARARRSLPFDLSYEDFVKQALETACRLLAELTGKPPFAPEDLVASLPKDLARKGLDHERSLKAQFAFEQICAIALDRYRSSMRQSQQFDHDEIAQMALRLVLEDESVRNRLRGKFKVLLVDESQDLNRLQVQLLEALGIAEEMFVGDYKQSIFRFRGADVSLFLDRSSQVPTLPLSKSHRTRKQGILQFIDEALASYFPHYQRFISDLDQASNYEGVELWESPDPAEDATVLAAYIEQLVQADHVPVKDICVLVRNHAEALNISLALQARDLPVATFGGRSFYSDPLIRDLANLLELFENPGDNYRLFGVLRSPIVGVSLDTVLTLLRTGSIAEALVGLDECAVEPLDRAKLEHFNAWFRPLAQVADRFTAWDVMSQVVRCSPLMEALAQAPNRIQNLANLRKLMEISGRDGALRPGEFAEQIRAFQRFYDEEGPGQIADLDDPFIKVMTIYSAKGLEFPVTILATMRQQKPKKLFPGTVVSLGHGQTPYVYFEPNWFIELIDRKRARLEEAESQRLLYVALTRAEERLVVLVPPRDIQPSPEIRRIRASFTSAPGIVFRESPLWVAP